MPSDRPHVRELAERTSSAEWVRLLWREGTRLVWIEVSSRQPDQALAIPVAPEHALDAFHHPYAYAGRASGCLPPRRSSARARPSNDRPREIRGQ